MILVALEMMILACFVSQTTIMFYFSQHGKIPTRFDIAGRDTYGGCIIVSFSMLLTAEMM